MVAVKVHCQLPFLNIGTKRARIWYNDDLEKLRGDYIIRGVQKYYAAKAEMEAAQTAKIAALAAGSSVLTMHCYFLRVMFRPQARAVWVIGYQSTIVELLTAHQLVTNN